MYDEKGRIKGGRGENNKGRRTSMMGAKNKEVKVDEKRTRRKVEGGGGEKKNNE